MSDNKNNTQVEYASETDKNIMIPNINELLEKFHLTKEVIPVPLNERSNIIYKLLKENCDVIFCTEQSSEEFKFVCLEQFAIFAVDSNGNSFGTIDGIGDLEDDTYSVGYVTAEGRCGKIATNLKEFLELVTFYPFWNEILEFERLGIDYPISELESEKLSVNPQYFKNQKEIAKLLNLNKNLRSIELLKSNLKAEPRFVVYGNAFDNLI